jgi:hypothetical protein
MEISYFIKLKLFIYIIGVYIFSFFIFRFFSFEKILKKIKNVNINKSTKLIHDEKIYFYERYIANKVNVKKCFISCICLFIVFRRHGFNPKFCIGIRKRDKIESHSWIELNNKYFLLSEGANFQKILKI